MTPERSLQETSQESEAKEVILLILEGCAVGTFIYVTFFEVRRELTHPVLISLARRLDTG